MNILILNASPKKKGGASRFLSGMERRIVKEFYVKSAPPR